MNVRILLPLALIAMICPTGFCDEHAPLRENIEWVDLWLPDNNVTGQPRVLLIGDSITRAYYPTVADALKGKATVGRLTTSASVGDPALLAQVEMVLSQYRFDVVHFNNGLHGAGYTEAQYEQDFPAFLKIIETQTRGAMLIWATSTPVRDAAKIEEFSPPTERVKKRNQIATQFVTKQKIAVNDLYGLVVDHPEWWSGDGVHFAQAGIAAEAAQVVKYVTDALLR
jgi:hypothetical protein